VPPYQDLVELVESGKMSEAEFSTELAEVVTGKARGRTHADEIWIGMNPAYGILDVATADFVYRRAKAMRVGTELQP
jgi:ornithine cyclodeaminase/alanine dehydrogenase-like protein (mu-crystallin family)